MSVAINMAKTIEVVSSLVRLMNLSFAPGLDGV